MVLVACALSRFVLRCARVRLTRRHILLATSAAGAAGLAGAGCSRRGAPLPGATPEGGLTPVPRDAGVCIGVSRSPDAARAAQGPLPLHPDALPSFVDPLPVPPVLAPQGVRPDPTDPTRSLNFYRVAMRASEIRIHRDVPPTRVWGYEGSVPGPTIAVRKDQGVVIEWVNELPDAHFLPVDHGLCGAGPELPEVRTVVHVHGARVRAESDGYPEAWFPRGKSAVSHYPNQQDAATLWYHDHAIGLERLNQYAGLFGMFLVRDPVEDALGLPAGAYELPLLLADRFFDASGQLIYPTSGDPGSPWVPEVRGDATLANGKLRPYAEVQPCLYRLRVVNASNARVFDLQLEGARPRVWQIGTDQGLLQAPVPIDKVTLAPA